MDTVNHPSPRLRAVNFLAVVALFGYWTAVWYAEYGSPHEALTAIAPQFISVSVLRHLLPLVLGGGIAWLLARQATWRTTQTLYDLADLSAARTFLRRRQWGAYPPAREPYGKNWLTALLLLGGGKARNPNMAAAGGCFVWLSAALVVIATGTAVWVWDAGFWNAAVARQVQNIFGGLLLAALGGALLRFLADSLMLDRVMPISEAALEHRRKEPLLQIGGPGKIFVGRSDIALTERNGRVGRVLPTGLYWLSPFERIRNVIDLRPQIQVRDHVEVVTRDGIRLTTGLSVTFRIDRGLRPATRQRPFPFEEKAVRRAAYDGQTVFSDRISDWKLLTLNIAHAQLAEQIALFGLDELLFSLNPGDDNHRTLRDNTRLGAQAIMGIYGVTVEDVRLDGLKLPPLVGGHRVGYWRTLWERIHAGRSGRARLNRNQVETEYAQIKAETIEKLANEMRKADERIRAALRRKGQQDDVIARHYVSQKLLALLQEMLEEATPGDESRHQMLESLRLWRRRLNRALRKYLADDSDPGPYLPLGN